MSAAFERSGLKAFTNPIPNNKLPGPRTRREAIKAIYSGPWSP